MDAISAGIIEDAMMQIPVEKLGEVAVVKVQGRLDVITSPDFENQCASLIAQGEKFLVADFGGLAYIASAGLRSILATVKKLKAVDGSLAVCCLQPMVEQVFALAGFTGLIPIFKTLDEALEKIQPKSDGSTGSREPADSRP
jgi:anti-anti-sigma factor